MKPHFMYGSLRPHSHTAHSPQWTGGSKPPPQVIQDGVAPLPNNSTMKFPDANWMMREGGRVFSPAQVYDGETADDATATTTPDNGADGETADDAPVTPMPAR